MHGRPRVLAFAIARRTREIGVRMALGAQPLDVTRMILARGVKLGLAELVVGIALAIAGGTYCGPCSLKLSRWRPGFIWAPRRHCFLLPRSHVLFRRSGPRVDPMVTLHDE